MSGTDNASRATRSGIRKLSNGESVIPSSTRADGSVRKEIRVKPGYRPPEDVEIYKNRTAEAWKNRGKGGVPGAESIQGNTLPASSTANKNAKRREARKKAAATTTDGDNVDGESVSGNQQSAVLKTSGVDTPVEEDPEAEKAKEARKLAKKLRQARELKDKKEKGEGMLPEQMLKITRISELVRQLENMGFDHDGERKPAADQTEKSTKPPTD